MSQLPESTMCYYRRVSAIAAQVDLDPISAKRLVTVSVDASQARQKAFLGGYRHKENGTIYHHASDQTAQIGQRRQPIERCCREAQTIEVKSRSTQNVREFGTQMPRPDLVLDDSSDRVVCIGNYFTSEEQERSDLIAWAGGHVGTRCLQF